MNNFHLVNAAIIMGIALTGCGVNTWYNPAPTATSTPTAVDLSQKTPAFREGYEAGCKTAQGEYTKSSERFNADSEYHDGWFAGRSACQAQ